MGSQLLKIQRFITIDYCIQSIAGSNSAGSVSVIMGLIRSNLNSVCSVSDNFVSLKRRITTCLKDWRQKATKSCVKQYTEQQRLRGKTKQNIKFINNRLKDLFITKKTEYFETFRLKRTTKNSQEEEGSESEIVTKILLTATAVVAAQTTTTTTSQGPIETTSTVFPQLQCKEEAKAEGDQENFISTNISWCRNNSVGDMTIISDVFLEIRDEFPDLEAEVRSLLTARAQNGATICEIRDDYKKLTGRHFPIYNNITEFLLSIPNVTAYCSERGTRIFNIIPSERTQHVYDLVTTQKPEQVMRPYIRFGHNTVYREEQRNNNEDCYYNNDNHNHAVNINRNNRSRYTTMKFHNANRFPPTENVPLSDYFVEKKKSTFEENFCHLQNRFNLSPQVTVPTTYRERFANEMENNNNDNDAFHKNNNDVDFIPSSDHNYNNNITMFQKTFMPLNNLTNLQHQRQQQQVQYQQKQKQQQHRQEQQIIQNTLKPSRLHPCHPTQIVRHSSPTATRSSEYNDSVFTLDSEFQAHLWDFLLLGDDFFLYLARMELRCKFKKYERVLQSGLCISGQTITAATKRIRQLVDVLPTNRSIIVNIGSVDIMQGKPLVEIEHEFRSLISSIQRNGFTPILTTLAPLANYAHIKKVKEKLERFNNFIKREGRQGNNLVIDIWSCLVNEKENILFDCFQNEPRRVSGTSEPYVFWNKIGRQRVLQLITDKIEY